MICIVLNFLLKATSTSIDKSAPLEILPRPAQFKRPLEDTQLDSGKKVHFDEEVRHGKVSLLLRMSLPPICSCCVLCWFACLSVYLSVSVCLFDWKVHQLLHQPIKEPVPATE